MRLIDARRTLRENTIVFDYQEPDDVQYLVLSHCWGRPSENKAWAHDDQEYTYQDALASPPPARKLAGFDKIFLTCKLASRAKVRYVWIDTCCLDQTNYSELAHGINSMFEWYRKSSFCVVYLADVTWTQSMNQNERRKQFVNCRWFERAWTLQELIAPKEVRFYDKDWNYMGTKVDLADEISEHTHIDKHILNGTSSCLMCSIAHRMSWAAKRKARKPEDIAYSLLGIFNVNMPMIYGEGSRNAFHRLQRAITTTTSELSIFGWGDETLSNSNNSSVFADSPVDFIYSDGLIGNIPEKHYELTNKGVLMTYALRKVKFEKRDRRYYRLFLVVGYRPARGGPAMGGQLDVIGIFLRKIDNEVFMRAGPPERYPIEEYQKFSKTPTQTFYIVSSLDDYYSRMSDSKDAIYIPQTKNIEIIKAAPEAAWDHERGMFFSRPYDESATGLLLKILPNNFSGEKVKVVVIFDRKESPPRYQVIKIAEDPEFAAFISFLFGSGERIRWDAIPAYYKRLEKQWPSEAEVDVKDNRFRVSATLSKNQRDQSFHLDIKTDLINITLPNNPSTRSPSPTLSISPTRIKPDELLSRLDYDTLRLNLQKLYPGLFARNPPVYNPSNIYTLNNLTASVESFIANS
ncbi:heterokaryon incompatibility protein-domain-containing protein [Hypoxylon fuscum]|nr:heterokaryon incompatibility protein-domain-containing protein [Hypoxylon fuscum]